MLKVNKIEKNYKNFHLDCTMEVPAGCITGLIGENGAGKSTTFKAIENLIFLDGGSVELFWKPNRQRTPGRKKQTGVGFCARQLCGFL